MLKSLQLCYGLCTVSCSVLSSLIDLQTCSWIKMLKWYMRSMNTLLYFIFSVYVEAIFQKRMNG